MKLQVAIYAVAAKKELEYQPEQGLVRYLDPGTEDKRELRVPLDEAAIKQAASVVAQTAAQIRDRKFKCGPATNGNAPRCGGCDFVGMCGMPEAIAHKNTRAANW